MNTPIVEVPDSLHSAGRIFRSSVATLCLLVVGGCSSTVDETVPVPRSWGILYADGTESDIEFDADGTGILEDVPEGLFADCSDGASVEGSDEPIGPLWSGKIAW